MRTWRGAPTGRSSSPRWPWTGTPHAGRCIGNGPGYGSASSTAWSSGLERRSEMPRGGGFRACAATTAGAGPPTAAMVAAASRLACEVDASP